MESDSANRIAFGIAGAVRDLGAAAGAALSAHADGVCELR